MKLLKLSILLAVLFAAFAFGQISTQPPNVYHNASAPATCSVGDVWFKTGVTAGQNWYGCTASNTWTLQSGTSSPGGSSGQFQFNNSAAFGGFTDLTITTDTVAGTSALIWDMRGAAHTLAVKSGVTASKPGTCTIGEIYFATDATAGQNLYFCTATNTWTQQLNSGGGGCTDIVAWTAPSLLNSWTNVGGAQPAQYRVDCTGRVLLRGLIAPGTTTNGTTLFTLPSNARPTYPQSSITYGDNTVGFERLQFNANGDVKINGSSAPSTVVDLNGGTVVAGGLATTFCRTVTVQSAQVTANQTNFPVLISGTFNGTAGIPDLRTIGNGGAAANGNDIGFYSDSGCTVKLPWETASYSATTGAAEYHVLPASISSTSNTPFYIGYGDTTITTDQSNKTAVWTNGFAGVYHLATTAGLDSTSNANNGTNNGSTACGGKIDGATCYVNASTQFIDLGAGASLDLTSTFTIEAWAIYNDSSSNHDWRVFSKLDCPSNCVGYELFHNSSGLFSLQTGNGTSSGGNEGGGLNTLSISTPATQGTTYYVATTFNGTANASIYLNGALDTALTNFTTTGSSSTTHAFIGQYAGGGHSWEGTIDEVRISNVVRSATWISTAYNNQNSPSTFIAFGP